MLMPTPLVQTRMPNSFLLFATRVGHELREIRIIRRFLRIGPDSPLTIQPLALQMVLQRLLQLEAAMIRPNGHSLFARRLRRRALATRKFVR